MKKVTLVITALLLLVSPGLGQRGGNQPPANPAIAFIKNLALWVMNADGSNQTQIFNGANGRPSWSPDGHSIAFWGAY